MIDLQLLRFETEKISNLIKQKDPRFPIDDLIEMDKKIRSLRLEIENIKKRKNELADSFSKAVDKNKLRKESEELSHQLSEKELFLEPLDKKFKEFYLACPNIPIADLPQGNKEANKVVKMIGEKKTFSFKPQNHVELNKKVNWFDFEAGAAMSGSQFVFFLEQGIKLTYALTQMMLKNNAHHKFTPVKSSEVVLRKCLYNSGNLPKFEGDFYEIPSDGLVLIPTSEVSLANLHAEQIFTEEQLPLRYTSWTNCFRREAGGYGASERGLIRVHQFDKVELYSFVKPEDSYHELDYMLSCAEKILQELGLHYRVSLLAMQDCSFASAKTYDIEVWLPGQNCYYEVSSTSNCTDFQSRRAGIRYRDKKTQKTHLVHTLNASSLALPRLMVALMETYQKEDGSIDLPIVLKNKMDSLW